MERPGESSLRRPNRNPPCPGAGGGRARVPGPDAEPPCHGPRLRHLAVARAISRRDGLGAQGVRRPVSAAASADEIAGAPRRPGGRPDPERGRLRQPHEYRCSRRPRRGRSLLHRGLIDQQGRGGPERHLERASSRGLPRKFTDYLSVLVVGPVLVFAAFGIIASLRSSAVVERLLQVTRLQTATVFVAGHVAPLLLLGAAFTFLYRFLPYTHVRLSAAVVGGLSAAVLWQISSIVFAALVASSTTYAAIYSTFAVLVLSLIWLQVAWLVVLIGGQIAYVHQCPTSYAAARQRHGVRFRDEIGLMALVEVARRHQAGLAAYTMEELAVINGAPLTILEDLVEGFVARGMLARAVEPPGLILARPADQLLVVDLLDAIRNPGVDDVQAHGAGAAAVLGVLRRQDEVLRDALQGLTLQSLASETAATEGTVADLAQYRRS